MNSENEKSNKPTHQVKVRHGQGRTAYYEKIGAAWINDDGSIFVKLVGTQVVSEPFTLYPIDRPNSEKY